MSPLQGGSFLPSRGLTYPAHVPAATHRFAVAAAAYNVATCGIPYLSDLELAQWQGKDPSLWPVLSKIMSVRKLGWPAAVRQLMDAHFPGLRQLLEGMLCHDPERRAGVAEVGASDCSVVHRARLSGVTLCSLRVQWQCPWQHTLHFGVGS